MYISLRWQSYEIEIFRTHSLLVGFGPYHFFLGFTPKPSLTTLNNRSQSLTADLPETKCLGWISDTWADRQKPDQ